MRSFTRFLRTTQKKAQIEMETNIVIIPTPLYCLDQLLNSMQTQLSLRNIQFKPLFTCVNCPQALSSIDKGLWTKAEPN